MRRFCISLAVDAESPEEALGAFQARVIAASDVESVGYVLPDGELTYHAPVPPGYTLQEVYSEYYGSHSEYGEGDERIAFALPDGATMPESFRLSHGGFSLSWGDLRKLPAGTLWWWDGHSCVWTLVEEDILGWDLEGKRA